MGATAGQQYAVNNNQGKKNGHCDVKVANANCGFPAPRPGVEPAKVQRPFCRRQPESLSDEEWQEIAAAIRHAADVKKDAARQ